MAITIHVGSDLFERDLEPCAVFWKAIIYYLDELREDFNLKKLVNCDPYGEVVFSLEYCKLLDEELPEFLKLVKERKLLEPSSINKLDKSKFWDEGPETLSWGELETFLMELQLVIAKAIEQNRSIIVVGD